MRTSGVILAVLLLTLGSSRHALAHQFWLSPSTYAASPGRPVEVGAFAGTGFRGEEKPWSPDHAVRFAVRAARTLDLARAAAPGDFAWARFAPSDAGGAMLGFESTFTPIQLPAAAFDRYLDDEGLTAALRARAKMPAGTPGRERYRRCAKAWLSGGDPSRATAPLGLPLEIVPAVAPGTTAALSLLVLRSGRPLGGARVQAWLAPLGEGDVPRDAASRDSVAVSWRGQTDSGGRAVVPVSAAGEWLLSVVDMVPSHDRAEADWESTWASLTFVRLHAAPAAREAASR
jgi:uncharacterized protein DUF4198